MASVHIGLIEDDLDSDVEIIERQTPIPGHHARGSRGYLKSSESTSSVTISSSSSVETSDLDSSASSTSDDYDSDAGTETLQDSDLLQKNAMDSRSVDVVEDETTEPDGRIPHVHAIPKWFPSRIRRMFKVDRKGGALKFKELDEMTMFRAVVERVKRVCWREYIDAGRKRYQFQRYLKRHRHIRRSHRQFYKFQRQQYEKWKDAALEKWKILEKMHLGVRVLDETIHLNFRMERLLYERHLGGRFRD